MATTTKTLTPTNQTITLPDMTERPNASVLVDGIGKDADAINALSEQIVSKQLTSSSNIDSLESGNYFFASLPSGIPDFVTEYTSILKVNKVSSSLAFQSLESPYAFAYRYYVNGNWSVWNVLRNIGDAKYVTFDLDYSSGRMTFYFNDASGNSCRLWLTSSGFILQKKAANESNWTTLKTV